MTLRLANPGENGNHYRRAAYNGLDVRRYGTRRMLWAPI